MKNKVETCLKKPIADNTFSLLREQDLLAGFNEFVSCSKTLDEVNANYAIEIVNSIEQFVQDLQPVIIERQNLADSAKQRYAESKKSYDSQIVSIQSKISELEQMRSELSFFAFSEKKRINSEILTLKEKMDMILQKNEPQQLYEEYNKLLKETASFKI